MRQPTRAGPMAKRAIVTRPDTERAHLLPRIKHGTGSSRPRSRAHTRLQTAGGQQTRPWPQESWGLPRVSAALVWRLAASLDLDAEPDDPQYPLGGVDEPWDPLGSELRQARLVQPAQPVRYDDESRRAGTCNVCRCFASLPGGRQVQSPERRTPRTLPTVGRIW
jgi:hypothetical protein